MTDTSPAADLRSLLIIAAAAADDLGSYLRDAADAADALDHAGPDDVADHLRVLDEHLAEVRTATPHAANAARTAVAGLASSPIVGR